MSLNIFSYEQDKCRSMSDLRLRKAELKAEIAQQNGTMNALWQKLKSEPKEHSTPSQRFKSMFSSGANIMDGLILGWKLYRIFGSNRKQSRKGIFSWKNFL